ncbi:hypothetical protein B0T22DRAFT_485631 [Podospora appendiculata]|uniref:Uncharacterized protein n=1 Tax=Podospora appendiculata TaxID=314037 RepID=A0AAE1C760_9PEZI|nr:hypothetical protein B0T22DRAFT_485631 [Podospora appendiculata]
MPLRQNTFTLVPNPLGMQGLLNRPDHERPPVILPAMTSKQAKKAYKEKNKVPRMSKAEQLRIEREEQARIKKELEKDKAARKARAARDKKKTKEQAEAEEKRRKRLPLVSVHPSQDTISRFFRGNGGGARRDSTGSRVDEQPIAEEGQVGEHHCEQEENEQPQRDGHRDEEHLCEEHQKEEPAGLDPDEPAQSQRKRRRLSQENSAPPVSHIRGSGTPTPRALPVIHEDQENEPTSGEDVPSERERIIPRSPDIPKPSSRLVMPPPSSSLTQAFRKSRLERSQAPRNATPGSSQGRVLPPKSSLPRMPLQEISENRPRQIANLSKVAHVTSSCKPRRSIPAPSSLRPAETLPTSTQLFVMSHLDDFPTPSQAAQEMEEEFPATRPTTPAEEAQTFVMEHLDDFPTPSQEARELQEEAEVPTTAAKAASTQLLVMSHWDDWFPTPSQEARELMEVKSAVVPQTHAAPRLGTQLFMESHLHDFFPTPTQEARELAEEFPSAPATALPNKPKRTLATASKSAPGLGQLARKLETASSLGKTPRTPVATPDPPLPSAEQQLETAASPGKTAGIPVEKGDACVSTAERQLEEDLAVVEDLLKSQGPPFNVPRDPNASPEPLRFLGSHGLRLELLMAVQESRQTFQEQEQERKRLRDEETQRETLLLEKQCGIQVDQGKQMEILSDPSETDYFDNDLDEGLLGDLVGF